MSGREDEIDAALGDAAPAFKAAYDVTPRGNWEGRKVLRRVAPRGSPAEEAALAASRARLFALRESAPEAGARRQGSRRLERPDDRRARPRRRRVRRARLA